MKYRLKFFTKPKSIPRLEAADLCDKHPTWIDKMCREGVLDYGIYERKKFIIDNRKWKDYLAEQTKQK